MPSDSVFETQFDSVNDRMIYQSFDLVTTMVYFVLNIGMAVYRFRKPKKSSERLIAKIFKNLGKSEVSMVRLIFSFENVVRMSIYLRQILKLVCLSPGKISMLDRFLVIVIFSN
jgi:hypothetical protein